MASSTVSVQVDSESVPIVLDEVCPHSELFARYKKGDKLDFGKFPGGAPLLRSVLALFRQVGPAPDPCYDGAALTPLIDPPLSTGTLQIYLEAAVMLGCPGLMGGLSRSRACEELTSRSAVMLLETVLLLTRESGGTALSGAMQEAFVEVLSRIGAKIEARDFRLGPALATGNLRASLEVLNVSRAHDYRGSVDATSGTAVSVSAARGDWTPQQFALHVIRHYLLSEAQAAQESGRPRVHTLVADETLLGGEKDTEANEIDDASCELQEDVPEDQCDLVTDEALSLLAGFSAFLDASTVPSNLAYAMVRALVVAGKEDQADYLFQQTFPRSTKVQSMPLERLVPVGFLRGVSTCRAAAVTFRRILARYAKMDQGNVCDLIDNLLLVDMIQERHAHDVILGHPLTRDLVLWMRSGGADGGAKQGARAFVAGASAERLRDVGARLFRSSFVVHGGFLALDADECPWDTGALDFPLLAHVPSTEDSLQLVRQVLLRLFQQQWEDVRALARLWDLGRWQLCQDPVLISDAFAFLCRCWRAVQGCAGTADLDSMSRDEALVDKGLTPADLVFGVKLIGQSRQDAEEVLFGMFTDLEVWRLPSNELLTPWVPGQLLASHVAAQCKQLEDRQRVLVEETRENLEEIAWLNAVIAKLGEKLDANDARSQDCMKKQSDINDAVRQLRV